MSERQTGQTGTDREIQNSPRGFPSIVGQREVLWRLEEFAGLLRQHGTLGNVLLTGPEGIGKRTIAHAFAAETDQLLIETAGPDLRVVGNLFSFLTQLKERGALLISAIDKLPKSVTEFLLDALTDGKIEFVSDKGMFKKTISVPIGPFTLLGTATSAAECPRQLLEVFHLTLPVLQRYSDEDLTLICRRIAYQKGIPISADAAAMLATASHGTPHEVELILSRVASLGFAEITRENVTQLLSVLGLSPKVGGGAGLTAALEGLSGVEFEQIITGLLQRMGFRAEMTKASGDGGIDIVATLDLPIFGGKYLFQCKCFQPGNLVGAASVREFYGAVNADQEAVKGVLITTSGFTPQALEFARGLPLELISGNGLQELLIAEGTLPSGGATTAAEQKPQSPSLTD